MVAVKLSPDDFRVGDWLVRPSLGRIEHGTESVHVTPRSMAVLVYLAEAAGRVVSRNELLDTLWPRMAVTQDALAQCIVELRKAFRDDSRCAAVIETIPKVGIRLMAPAVLEPQPSPELPGAHVAASGLRNAGSGSTEQPHRPPPDSLAQAEFRRLTDFAGAEEIAVCRAASASTPHRVPPPPAGAPQESPQASLVSGRGPFRRLGWRRLYWAQTATLGVAAVLAVSWAITHYPGASKPAESTSPGLPPAIHSLVVLPLENLSGDKEQEYFADGMTDALTTDLAQVGSLRVISRTSAMQFKGSKETLPQIGRNLQVDAVVEGTVARGENRVRVTAQLVEASSDHHLWAKTYERDLQNVLALQDEIAQDITEQIRVKVIPKERSQLIQVRAVDPEAYDDLLKGRYWLSSWTRDRAWKALEYFQKAIAKDPKYAAAYAGVADSFVTLQATGGLPVRKALPKAKEAAVHALAFDPSLADAHTSLATVKGGYDWDWFGAEAEYKQAIALSPNYATAHLMYSGLLLTMGRLDEAMKEIERARDLDPFSPVVTWWLGQVLYHARRYDDALRQDQRGLEMHPDNPLFYDAMADVYEQKKMFAEAFAARQQALTLENDPSVTVLDEAYKSSGYRGYLLKEAQILEQTHNPGYPAHQYALLNDEARAMTALEWSYNERDTGILFLRTAPELDSIRSSPRYRALVRRIGFPPSPSDKN